MGKKNEYNTNLYTKKAKLSGVAIKTSTAKDAGIYPVLSTLTGTGIITRILLASALKVSKKPVTGKVGSGEFMKAYDRIEENGFKNPLGVLYEKEIKRLPKSYGNYKTLKNRIKSGISDGAILGFTFKSPEDAETVSLFAKVKV